MNTPRRRISHTDIEAEAAEWIGRRDAGLTPVEEQEFERWREGDDQHREALARLETTWSALAGPLASGSASLLKQELESARRRRRTRSLSATAALIAICVAGWWSVRSFQAPAAPTALIWTVERRVLPDGSIVELPKGSEIALEFSPAERRVLLQRGDAHFQVTSDEARPFRVSAAQVDVRAVGTAFAVQLRESTVDLLVTEGRVAVTPTHAAPRPGELSPALVSAGHRVTIDAATPQTLEILAVTDMEVAERLAWRNPRVEFSSAPLAEVVALLNRHNSMRLTIADRALGDTALSGVFRLNDTEAFLRMLEKGFGATIERRDNEVVLRKAR